MLFESDYVRGSGRDADELSVLDHGRSECNILRVVIIRVCHLSYLLPRRDANIDQRLVYGFLLDGWH